MIERVTFLLFVTEIAGCHLFSLHISIAGCIENPFNPYPKTWYFSHGSNDTIPPCLLRYSTSSSVNDLCQPLVAVPNMIAGPLIKGLSQESAEIVGNSDYLDLDLHSILNATPPE